MSGILSFLVPVILGALIGWATNVLAIRMLFRPRKAWYVGPVHVPFTPGIIPRQRDRLARSLGHMVAVELFRPEAIIGYLDQPGLVSALEGAVGRMTAAVLGVEEGVSGDAPAGKSVGTAGQTLPGDGRLRFLLDRTCDAFLSSPRFATWVHAAVDGAGTFLRDQDGSRGRRTRMMVIAGARFCRNAASDPRGAAAGWKRLAEDWIARGLTVGDLTGTGWIRPLTTGAEALWPVIGQFLDMLLGREDIRRELQSRARPLLSDFLGRLNPVQRSLLRMGGYESRLQEMLPDFVDQALESMREFVGREGTRRAWAETLESLLGQIAECPVAELASRYGVDPAAMGPGMADGAGRFLARVAGGSGGDGGEGRTPGELMERALGIPLADLSGALADQLVLMARTPGGRIAVREGLGGLLRGMAGLKSSRPKVLPAIAGADGLMPGEKQDLDRMAAGMLREALGAVIPPVLDAFDIAAYVERRVESLDAARLEDMIVGLAGKEFRWISLLGGFLGGIVGLVQALLQAAAWW